jgi:hypothetical protein
LRIKQKVLLMGAMLALATSAAQPAAAAPRPAAGGEQAGATRSVTLLTGDRVIVASDDTVAIRRASGRARIGFSTYRGSGHLYVIPSDAIRLVSNGTLDRRLFDVTLLVESQYDDAHRKSLPVIVTYNGSAPAGLAVSGTSVTQSLPSVNGVAISADKGSGTLWASIAGTQTLAGSGIRKVWLDGKHQANLDRSVPQIGAPSAWAAGFTGTGVKIAVLDTGVDQTHPDLATQEVAEKNFSDAADNVDRFGHGTHVASIAAGTGAKSGGRFKGVAFGAQILDGKVLNDFGGGQESWIIAGMQWAAEQGAKVANLSLGGDDSASIDPLEEAVNNLSAQFGILYVIAAGNSGSAPETVGSPGSADAALTVGAVDRDDSIAPFSSRGPRVGDGAVKPDITAPGVGIVAAKAANGFIGTPAADGYVSLSGTSMATPHVAGSVALIAQQHPTWTGAQLKAALTASAKPNPALTAYDQGSGRVDVTKAITQTITSEPASVSLGTALWPHNDDVAVTKPLTYHNLGGSDVTLDLAVSTKGPDGRAAPNGMFSLSANKITVPAGGTAQVSLTGDPRLGSIDGAYTGAIVASSGSASAVTPFAINREVESYNVTFNVRGLDGAPTADYFVALMGYDDDRFRFPYDPDGSLTLRLPKGRYFADTELFSGSPTDPHVSSVVRPNLTVASDLTLDTPASAAKPVSVTPPDPAAHLLLADIGFDVRTAHSRIISASAITDLVQFSITQLGPPAPAEALTTKVITHWATPSEVFYGLAWFEHGTVPTGFTKVVRQRDVGRLNVQLDTPVPDRAGIRLAVPRPGDSDQTFTILPAREVQLPSRLTEFYNSDSGRTQWSSEVITTVPATGDFESDFISGFREFRPGSTQQARFNHAVFGPAFPDTGFPAAFRFGDFAGFRLPLFGDSDGNAGLSPVDSGSTKLFRNGQLVGETANPGSGSFTLPPEAADYRLTTSAVRPGIFDVTTRIDAAWTFRSAHTDDTGLNPTPLPLSAIRFTPKLDDANTARAGRPLLVPVALQLQSGATVRPPRLSVEVSYDEGKTWRPAQVLGNLAVLLFHPAGATSVSLRAKASDRDGNTVEQTLIRAYKLR